MAARNRESGSEGPHRESNIEGDSMPIAGKFVSQPIRVDLEAANEGRAEAEIVFHGVDQSGPSYEARVFLNNPDADLHTPLTSKHGYAGSFHVYGYGLWSAGEASSCTTERSRTPMTRSLIATDAIRRALAAGPDVTVTVVALKPGQEPRGLEPGLRLEGVSIASRKS